MHKGETNTSVLCNKEPYHVIVVPRKFITYDYDAIHSDVKGAVPSLEHS